MREKQKNRIPIIQKHYEMGISITEIANKLNVSKSTIQRDVKYLPEISHKIRNSNKKIDIIETPSYFSNYILQNELENFLKICNEHKCDVVFTKQINGYQYIIKFDTEQPISFALNLHKEMTNNDYFPIKTQHPFMLYRDICNKKYENIIEINNFTIDLKRKDIDIILDDILISVRKNKIKTIEELKNYYKNNTLISDVIIENEKYLNLAIKYK